MDEGDLGRLLGEAAPTPSASEETLRAIVRRHHRRTTWMLGTALVVALVAGPLVGASLARRGDSGQTVSAGSPAGGARDQSKSGEGFAAPTTTVAGETVEVEAIEVGPATWRFETRPGRQMPLERLFVRTTDDGVAVRAYRGQPAPRPPCSPEEDCPTPLPAECMPASVFLAELSNEGAVGPRDHAPIWSTHAGRPITLLRFGRFGGPEGSPAEWVALRTGPEVKRVRARFAGGGSDEMEPVQGYAVLAHQLPAVPPDHEGEQPRPGADVEALDASGRVVASEHLDPGSSAGPPAACRPNPDRPPEGIRRPPPPPPRHGQYPLPGGDQPVAVRPPAS